MGDSADAPGRRPVQPQKASYLVRGLDCAEEVAVLKKALTSLEGVLDLDFDILKSRMIVTYDARAAAPDGIEAAVGKAGMRAVPWTGQEARDGQSFWERRGRVVMAGLGGALLAAAVLSRAFLYALSTGGGAPPLAPALLYLGSIAASAWFVLPKAADSARNLEPDMNLLMVLAVAGAVAIGEWFEGATVAFLFAVALLLEHWSVGRARRAIESLLDLSPTTARFIPPQGAVMQEGPVEDVPVGSVLLVRPGERIPLDGLVVEGRTSVNQAPITGEAMPVEKGPGDEVYAGTINGDGALRLRASKPASDTTLARIIHMIEEAHSRRAPSEQWVDRFARYYTPAMIALAAAIVLGPPLLLGAPWTAWLYRGLVILVIACPCALVISTPVSIVSGLTSAARNGVLIKGGVYLEVAGRLRGVALDKTGTLTHGRPEVQEVVPLDGHTREELLGMAAALEANSEHPLARAILQKAEAEKVSMPEARDFRAVQGKGAEATLEDTAFWIGSHRLMDEKGLETPEVHNKAEEMEDAGHSVVALGNDMHVCGLISVGDRVRDHAPQAVAALKDLGVRKVVMLTGDNEGTARAVAAASGVDDYRSELLPEGKVEAVRSLAREVGRVTMVGDGVNDAPAMAAADFGVAMAATGTHAAIETADVALMSDDLLKLPWLMAHSRRTLRTVKANIGFALGVKAAFVALALAGLATLWMAIAADMGASLLVIFNGLRLLRAEDVRSSAHGGRPQP